MSALENLEKQLNEWLNIKVPIKLPTDVRKSLANALWIIALIVGIVQLWGVWVLWHLGHFVQQAITYGAYIAGPVVSVHLGLFYWVALLASAVAAVLLLMAAPKLKQMQKAGWNLLYYAALLNAAYAIFRLFAGVDDVFSGFLGAAIGAVVGAFFLFQVRDYFTEKKSGHPAATHPAHHKK
jgi:hypothetical protein